MLLIFKDLKSCLSFFPSWISVSTGMSSFLRNLSPQVVSAEQESGDFIHWNRVRYEYFRAYQYGTCGSLIFLSFPLVGNPSYRALFKKGIQKDSGRAGMTNSEDAA